MASSNRSNLVEHNTTLSPGSASLVLEAACQAAGLEGAHAWLLRFGENAMFALASAPVVVRIGRSVEASAREAHVARWLGSQDFPAAHLADIDVEQPVVIGDTPATFWEFIEENDSPVTSADLGTVLRGLHGLPAPSDVPLPHFRPMPKIDRRLANLGPALPHEDRSFLSARKQELDEEFTQLEPVLGDGPIHGDAHTANLMRDRDGTVRLIDFEDFCWGPREWDVCVEAVRYEAFGWVSDEDYAAFVAAYGFDPRTWSGFPVVRAMRELNMTTWLAQRAGHSAEIDAEIRKRIADLRDEQAPRHWSAY